MYSLLEAREEKHGKKPEKPGVLEGFAAMTCC
jgi:hypothetical protein